ncbi:hypothetical protein LEL_05944 [Akanthomyces lecanii RCEF 1005]|uniref:Amidoligase enzyme n=1 Tax=Akanthomyces lecanii RCEF 1005 TaxID=1081108 RepID=A0A168GB28_CORDF|nr:hypothetical protein LEL_05944 [Akanthomyces lecanii RCEF 1005]
MLVEKQIAAGLTTVNYELLAIVDEPSLDEIPGCWSVEIVSRSISSKEWQGEIDHVFQLINENFDIYLSTGCSMHVHVSPAPLESHVYNLGQLQSILKATALYDKAITNVMPADRKENPYCQPNFAPRREKRHQSEKDMNNHIRDAFERVESQGWKGLFAQFDNLRPIQKNIIQLVFFGESRYLSWNFAHLASSCGTIEFRRPPGVRDAAAAKHWIAFTLVFLSGALALAHTFDPNSKTHATVEDLLELIETGHSTLPSYCKGALNPALLQVDSSSPHPYSGAGLTAIKRKKDAKKDKRSNFVEKLRSQPNSPAHD